MPDFDSELSGREGGAPKKTKLRSLNSRLECAFGGFPRIFLVCIRLEASLDQIGGFRQSFGFRRHLERFFRLRPNPRLSHQPCHAVLPTPQPLRSKLGCNPRRSVQLTAFAPDQMDERFQLLVLPRPRALRSFPIRIIAAPVDAQHLPIFFTVKLEPYRSMNRYFIWGVWRR